MANHAGDLIVMQVVRTLWKEYRERRWDEFKQDKLTVLDSALRYRSIVHCVDKRYASATALIHAEILRHYSQSAENIEQNSTALHMMTGSVEERHL
jgi:hypothetical protein